MVGWQQSGAIKLQVIAQLVVELGVEE